MSDKSESRLLFENDRVRVVARERYAVARVRTGKITEHEAEALASDLAKAAEERFARVIVDMKDVGLVTSAGIGMLMEAHKACEQAGGALVIARLSEDILGALRLARIGPMLHIEPDLKRARKRVLK